LVSLVVCSIGGHVRIHLIRDGAVAEGEYLGDEDRLLKPFSNFRSYVLSLGAKVIFSTTKMHFPRFSLSNSKISLLFGVPSVLHIEKSVPHISFDFFEPKSSDCDVIFWIPKM